MKDIIAYQGSRFTIEWYFDERDRSPALEYYHQLSPERQRKTMRLFKLIAEVMLVYNEEKFRNEGDQIYAFKPQPDRFLCFFFDGAKIIVTNAFEKKSQKLPEAEKSRAMRYKNDYVARINRGTYYDEEKK